MANKSGNAYALTILCPILPGVPSNSPTGQSGQTYTALLRDQLQTLHLNEDSPMAQVPNTYLCRFWVLSDVPYQGKPAFLEHLKSDYLVFSSNFYGELEPYITGMWNALKDSVLAVLWHCVGHETVHDASSFIDYIKKCQVTTTFFFNGSTDEPLADQLKNLYLKQEFSKFAFENQGKSARELQDAFCGFVQRTQPANLAGPTWAAGAYHLDNVGKGAEVPTGAEISKAAGSK
jgi:hypothetical protein